MKVFKVGGAVRDQLLGIVPKDYDFLVTESSANELLSLGYREVGTSFPVFIHPKTGQEYALPRGSTLKEDLFHRDLTINAMAIGSDGKIIDPFGGKIDLESKVLRHVSEFFADDFFRVYRVLRLKTQFPDFTIAPETIVLMKQLIARDEFVGQTPERIIKELKTVFTLPRPSTFFHALKEFKILTFFFQELEFKGPEVWDHDLKLLDKVSSLTVDATVRYASLFYNVSPENTAKLCERIRAPSNWIEAAGCISRYLLRLQDIRNQDAKFVVDFLYEIDSFRKPQLVASLAIASEALESLNSKLKPRVCDFFRHCFITVKSVSAKDVSALLCGPSLGAAIKYERIKALERAFSE